MRLIFIGILVASLQVLAFSQIEIVPLTSNAAVTKANEAKMADWNRTNSEIGVQRSGSCSEELNQDYGKNGGVVYATSGQENIFCLQVLSFDLLDSVACANCNELNNGSVSIDQFDFCITYDANPGIDLDFTDTLELIAFESVDTLSVFFPIIVKRPNGSIDVNTQTVQTDMTTNICLPNPNLPGIELEYFNEDCNNPILGLVGNPSSVGCFDYMSNRFGGIDQACILVCDEYCVCDSFNISINIITPPSRELPFFDDFSNGGPYPIDSLWLDDRVWVNNELAHEPPSIGVATFDGIGSNGTPYGGGYGPSDILTSTYINLSNNSPNDDVNLSFYLSPKGLGYPPTAMDSFKVEFKLQDGTWEEVDGRVADYIEFNSIPFPGVLDKIGFGNINVIPLDDPDYYHDQFQFRFINNCNRVGIQYVWHLDYVRLSDNVIDDNGSLNDIAFTKTPSLILKNYNHMPFTQFELNPSDEIQDDVSIELFNHFDVPRSLTNNSTMSVDDRISNQNLYLDQNFIPGGVGEIPDNFDPNSRFAGNIPAPLSSNISIPPGANEMELVTSYSYLLNEEFLIDTAIILNNNVSRTNYITDFFGYDDGSAEVAIKMDEEGASIASEFELNVGDELKGFEIYFPRFGNGQSSGEEFIVKVFLGSLNSDPIYTSEEIEVIFPDQFGPSVAAFTQYRLLDENELPISIDIPQGKMFFAIEQANNGELIYVGFDLNSDQFQSKQFFLNTNSLQWVPQSGPGAYMIRPVFGEDLPPATSVESVKNVIEFEIFPNPAQNELNIKTFEGNYDFTVYDIYGREVLIGALDKSIDVSTLADGLYYFQLKERGKDRSGVQKIQILR